MANIDFGSANGNLFPRWGKLGLVASQVRSYQSSQLTNLVGGNPPTGGPATLVGQLLGEPDVQALVGAAWISILNSAGSSVGGSLQGWAEQILNRVVYRAEPQLAQTLQQLATTESVSALLRQMRERDTGVRAHDSIAATPQTLGAPTAFFDNDDPAVTPGNGVIVTSVRRPLYGDILENLYAETLAMTITSDSFVGGATEFQEGWQLTGTGLISDPWAFNWPGGSDANVNGTAIDGRSSNGGGNVLTNSGFDAFTGNLPDNWERVTGALGTHIFAETSEVYGTGKALRITGDGSTLTQLRQVFGSSTGTVGNLDPLSQYSFAVWAKRDGTAPAAGSWVIDLVDGNGNVVSDQATPPNANSLTIDLTALSTVYTPYTFMVRTPLILPSTLYWRMRHPTGGALTNGRSVYFDLSSLGLATQAYTGGFYTALHSGSVLFKGNDRGTITATNGRSGGSLNTFQTLLFRLFYPLFADNEIIVPTRGTQVPDSLIG